MTKADLEVNKGKLESALISVNSGAVIASFSLLHRSIFYQYNFIWLIRVVLLLHWKMTCACIIGSLCCKS